MDCKDTGNIRHAEDFTRVENFWRGEWRNPCVEKIWTEDSICRGIDKERANDLARKLQSCSETGFESGTLLSRNVAVVGEVERLRFAILKMGRKRIVNVQVSFPSFLSRAALRRYRLKIRKDRSAPRSFGGFEIDPFPFSIQSRDSFQLKPREKFPSL